MTTESSKDSNWNQYFQATKSRPPHPTVIRSAKSFEKESLSPDQRYAIDLGCGAGRDTIYLLKENWSVLSVDHDQNAIDMLKKQVDEIMPESVSRFRWRLESFDSLHLNPESALLLNASYSLPFCAPEKIERLWMQICGALRRGGRFSGQFFGHNDTWATRPEMNFHSKRDLHGFFSGFELELFEERQEDKPTALGVMKHWHVFDVVAKKL